MARAGGVWLAEKAWLKQVPCGWSSRRAAGGEGVGLEQEACGLCSRLLAWTGGVWLEQCGWSRRRVVACSWSRRRVAGAAGV